MKFQDTSIHRLKVKKKVVRTHGHTDKPKAICPTNFFIKVSIDQETGNMVNRWNTAICQKVIIRFNK